MALFRLPWNYIPDPTRGKPLFFGKIYFGVADQDPRLFPKDVNLIQENGSVVVATQPILTSAGGVPVYNGSPVAIDLTGDYSIAIHDKDDAQVYYFANLTEVTNIIETSLRGAALRLNLDATLIGIVLVTNQSGQLLDDALYLQDTVTGLIYSLPDTIPAGSTVTSSSGTNLVTNNGSFTMHPVWVPVENRFKGNQNWNVAGSTGDPLPSATPTLYTVGAEIAAGRFVSGANLVNATYTGGLFNADSGSYYIEYDGDFTNDFYGIKLANNTIVTTGCTLSLVSGKTRLTVDMSVAPAHKFPGLSSEPGVWPDINDYYSSIYATPPEVSPRNNDWNGYLDPAHTVPIEYEDTSAGTRSFPADTEIAPNLYVSAATNVTFSTTGISWLSGNSLYKLYDYTAEQLASIDVNSAPVYLVGQDGSEHFVNNTTTGVNVSKVGGQLKVEITDAIFAGSFTKLWRFFPTERVGGVVELNPVILERLLVIEFSSMIDRTASRAPNITYTNGVKPRQVCIHFNGVGPGDRALTVTPINEAPIIIDRNIPNASNASAAFDVIIPPLADYSFNGTFASWIEVE